MEELRSALKRGDIDAVQALVASGGDIRFQDENGYDALIDAAYAFGALDEPSLIALLARVIELGAPLSGESSYGESAVSVLSHYGRFGAVKFLLKSGADPANVGFTPLLRASAFGTLDDLAAAIEAGADLEERDNRKRTAWLIAVQSGNIPKAEMLLQHGADKHARGHRGRPSTFFAVESPGTAMLSCLIAQGIDIGLKDDSGTTLLDEAVTNENVECVDLLIKARVDVNEKSHVSTALWHARNKDIVMRLLEAGADPNKLTSEGRRAILGFSPDSDIELLDVNEIDYLKHRTRKFGGGNPERMTNPFWVGMIRSGVNAYQAEMKLAGKKSYAIGREPTWCADRFGQSITFLPDGRIVQVAGEHEDGSDPDFCIYNDVFVHDVDGGITIYGYPEHVFPPTDFHSATLIGDHIYLIGSLGYRGRRYPEATQVFRLRTTDFKIEQLETAGDLPGWINRHRAELISPHEIRVSGGKVITWNGEKEEYLDNEVTCILDVSTLTWRSTD